VETFGLGALNFGAAGVVTNLPAGVTASGSTTVSAGVGTGTLTLTKTAEIPAQNAGTRVITVRSGDVESSFNLGILPAPGGAIVIPPPPPAFDLTTFLTPITDAAAFNWWYSRPFRVGYGSHEATIGPNGSFLEVVRGGHNDALQIRIDGEDGGLNLDVGGYIYRVRVTGNLVGNITEPTTVVAQGGSSPWPWVANQSNVTGVDPGFVIQGDLPADFITEPNPQSWLNIQTNGGTASSGLRVTSITIERIEPR